MAVSVQTVSTQPMAVSQTVTFTHSSPNTWNSGICDCCEDMGICCYAYWCFPCFQCSTAKNHGECLCLPLLDSGFVGYPCVPGISVAMRTSVRERYKIHGSIFKDCCATYWCLTCSWCQMAREIKQHKQPVTFMTAHTTMPIQQTVQYPVYPSPTY